MDMESDDTNGARDTAPASPAATPADGPQANSATTPNGQAEHVPTSTPGAPSSVAGAGPVATTTHEPTHDADGTEHSTATAHDGTLQSRTIAPDGTGTRVDTAADGTPVATWSIQNQPDGSRVETRLATPDDPSSAEITYEPDGRAILQEHTGDRAVETLTDPDGHTVRTTWTTGGDGPATMVERVEQTPQPDGSVVQAVSTTRGGPATITTFAADGQPVDASGDSPGHALVDSPSVAPESDHGHHDGGAGSAYPYMRPEVGPAMASAISAAGTSYHGGVVTRQVIGSDGATAQVRFTYGDGTQATTTRTTDPATGQLTDRIDATDGSTRTHTYDAGAPATGLWVTTRADGTTSSFNEAGDAAYGNLVRPDGSTVDVRISALPPAAYQGQVYSITETGPEPDFAQTTTTVSFDGNDHTQVWVEQETPDGHTLSDRGLLHVTDNPDRSQTTTVVYRDGDSDSFTVLDGHVVDHESSRSDVTGVIGGDRDVLTELPGPVAGLVDQAVAGEHGGVVGTTDLSGNGDGSTTVALTYADGTTAQFTRHVEIPNSRSTDTTVAPDGTVVEQHWALDPNRVVVPGETVTTHPDGSVSTLVGDQRDGYFDFVDTTTRADGSRTVFTDYGNGIVPNDRGEGTMQWRSVDTDPAGRTTITTYGVVPDVGFAATVEGPGGSRTVVPLFESNRYVGDGYAQVIVRPDGATETIMTRNGGGFDGYVGSTLNHWTTPPPATAPSDVTAPAAGPDVVPVAAPTDANAGYHGGTVKAVPTTNADGTQTIRVTYGDGRTAELARTSDANTGTVTDVHTEADGSLISRTYSANGSGPDLTTTTAADGTVTNVALAPDGGLRSDVVHPDGSWSGAAWGPGPDAADAVFSTNEHHVDGTHVATTVRPTAGGGYYASITSSDGTVETVRLAVADVENPDGSSTRIFTYPDGDTDAFTFDPAGTPVFHESHHTDGSALDDAAPAVATGPAPTGLTVHPDGSVTTVADGADGHRIESTVAVDGTQTHRDTAPDGGWTSTSDDGRGTTTDAYGTADGLSSVSTQRTDGSSDYVETNADGSSVVMHGDADGTFTQTYTATDGAWYSIVDHPDGTRTETDGDATGTSTTDFGADGSPVTHTDDGTSIVIRTNPDGTTEHVATAPDGTITEVTPPPAPAPAPAPGSRAARPPRRPRRRSRRPRRTTRSSPATCRRSATPTGTSRPSRRGRTARPGRARSSTRPRGTTRSSRRATRSSCPTAWGPPTTSRPSRTRTDASSPWTSAASCRSGTPGERSQVCRSDAVAHYGRRRTRRSRTMRSSRGRARGR